jgi:hypothetical protein
MRSDHGGGVPPSTSFAQALEELKREGSNLLLVGESPADAHATASDRFLGDDSVPRHRLFVFTAGETVRSGVPGPADPETARVVSQRTRDGTATPPGWPEDVRETAVDPDMLSPLAQAAVGAVDEAEQDGGLDPGEFRLCFDSVTPLLREHRAENVFRLLHLVTARVRQVGGMGHFHLRLDRDSDPVHVLEPMFDAVVEVRADEDGPRQRWSLRDRDLESDWIPV